MADAELEEQREQLPPLTCSVLLYRPLIDERWINRNTGMAKPHAFRRRRRDEHGLSVRIVAHYSISECVDSTDYNECFAVGTLHAGRILDILSDPPLSLERDTLSHANIVGLPANHETSDADNARREYLAVELAKQWRSVWLSLRVAPPHNRPRNA